MSQRFTKDVKEQTYGPYVLDGKPVSIQRVRNNNKSVLDPSKTQKLVHEISIKNQHGPNNPLSGALHLIAYFYFDIPLRSNIKPHDFYDKKPDVTFLLKYIEEVSLNVIFHNEHQIAITQTYKLYDTEPRTEFYLSTLE
jgi:Holliday junction resolvase RusA-like endonuclease